MHREMEYIKSLWGLFIKMVVGFRVRPGNVLFLAWG